jgi:hypothetical protein
MQKLFFMVAMLLTLHTAAPAETAVTKRAVTEKEAAEAKTLTMRLENIRAMDKSELNASERRELRREVREIKERLRDIGGGVYLSAAALIIIILLLILLL